MRVAIFTDNDFDKVNGVTTTLRAVLRWTGGDSRPRIYTAADVATDTSDYFAAAGFGIGIPWYREMRVYLPRLRPFWKSLAVDRPDVVHVTTPGPVGLAGRHIAGQLGVPLIGSYHTHLGQYASVLSGSRRLGGFLERYVRWFYSPCETLLAPSSATCDMLAAHGYDRGRLDVWARGVDAGVFSPDRRSRDLRASWHVDDRRPAILYAGRLSHEKGLALIPPLQRYLERRRIAHRFVFVGDGPMGDELRSLCPDAVFMGSVPHDRVAVAMASSDLFLFPSATDSLGNVVLEAQASGLPVLVSDRGGPRENILAGITGCVAGAGDVDAFGMHAAGLLREPERRRAMGLAARAFAAARDWPHAMLPLVGAWQRASAKRATPQSARGRQPMSASVTP